MLSLLKSTIGGVALATMIAATPFVATTSAKAGPSYYGAEVHQVGNRWKGGKNWNRNWSGNRHYYNRGWNGNNWIGPAIGFGAGVLLGSALTAPRYYAPAPRYYAPAYGNRDAYCHQKYRSYNSRTGTYTGYDGRQHYCRIP